MERMKTAGFGFEAGTEDEVRRRVRAYSQPIPGEASLLAAARNSTATFEVPELRANRLPTDRTAARGSEWRVG